MSAATACHNPPNPQERIPGPQERLIEALRDPRCYDHDTGPIVLIETHISWVLLSGDYAYKIKKALRLAFLDFSTLERRRSCCEEELRLNHRSAPDLYLGVANITGSPQSPRINGHGPVIEYAVKMRRFSQSQRLDSVLARGELERRHLRQLAHDMARLHRQAALAGDRTSFAEPARLRAECLQNFEALADFSDPDLDPQALTQLRDWSLTSLSRLEAEIQSRRSQGYIRECHGDLHLENLVLHQDRVLAFDCIEFNDSFRWIDVISEVAFLVMDLDYRGHADLGWEFLNAYLEQTGDYSGLKVLRYYQVYRAMVRAKVAGIRLRQSDLSATQYAAERDKLMAHLHLAADYSQAPAVPALMITQGLSGSGKSWLAAELAIHGGAIRIRSDVERKRLLAGELYSAAATRLTYRRLEELAQAVLSAGFSVIADATFLRRGQRLKFQTLARHLGVGFLILSTQARPGVLEQRIRERRGDASDATLEVLAGQQQRLEPLEADEAARVLVVETDRDVDIEGVVAQVCSRVGRGRD